MNTFAARFLDRKKTAWISLLVAACMASLQAAQNSDSTIALKRDPEPVGRAQLESSSFSDIVKRVSPSVVKITTQLTPRKVAMIPGFPGFDGERGGPGMPAIPRGG